MKKNVKKESVNVVANKSVKKEFKVTANEVSVFKTGGRAEVVTLQKSPYQIANILNKFVRGDFNSLEGINNDNAKEIARVLLRLKLVEGQRYAFDLRLLERDNFGRFVTRVKYNGYKGSGITDDEFNQISKASADNDRATDGRGRELIIVGGDVYALNPIAANYSAYFGAFAEIALKRMRTITKAQKDAESARRAAEKESAKAAKAQAKQDKENARKLRDIDAAEKKGVISPVEAAAKRAELANA